MPTKTKKHLVVYQENVQQIHLEDEDGRGLEEYSKSLSKFMSLNTISILKLSKSFLIARPSKICSILVEEEHFEEEPIPEKLTPIPVRKRKKRVKKEEMDIITDVVK